MKHVLLTAIALALCSGCAAKTAASPACEPVPGEFALAGETVYRDCAVDKKASPPAVMPIVSYTPPRSQTCGRVLIDVVVDSTGHPLPTTARVVRATDPGFGLAVLQSLPGLRYSPAVKDGRPVAQLVRVDRAYMVRMVAVPAGTSPSSIRPPRGRPPC